MWCSGLFQSCTNMSLSSSNALHRIYLLLGLNNHTGYTLIHAQILFPSIYILSSNRKRRTGLVHRVQAALGSFHLPLGANWLHPLLPDQQIITHNHQQEEVTLVCNSPTTTPCLILTSIYNVMRLRKDIKEVSELGLQYIILSSMIPE